MARGKGGRPEGVTLVFHMTEKEKETVEAVLKEGGLTRAAGVLGISPTTASMRLRRLMHRYHKAKDFIETVDYYRRKMPARYL